MEHEARIARDHEFARWYQTHHARIRALCTRILHDPVAAEDIAQETLLRAWERHGQMREADLGAWLSVVARNLCISTLRRDGRLVITDEVPDREDQSWDPAIEVGRRESRLNVRQALAKLGDRSRRVIDLREVREIGYDEIGSELGVTAEGARTIVFRARKALREHLVAVGEGFSGVLVGIRVRIRDLRTRARLKLFNAETGAMPVLQAGVNVALALGVALAGTLGTIPPSEARATSSSAAATDSTSESATKGSQSSSRESPESSIGDPPPSPPIGVIPRPKLKGTPFNPDDGSTYLHVTVGKYFFHFEQDRGPSEDGLEPAYAGLDAAAEAACDSAPTACDHLRAGFK